MKVIVVVVCLTPERKMIMNQQEKTRKKMQSACE